MDDEHAHLPYAEDTERKGGARALLGKRSCVSHPLPRGKKCRVSHVLPSARPPRAQRRRRLSRRRETGG